MSRNESRTRKELIDLQLAKAGWKIEDRNQVKLEIPVDGEDAEPWNGVTDYCLYNLKGEVIAVVEAKRQTRHPRQAKAQVRHYVTEIAKRQTFTPFAFMSNGEKIFFWDVGNSAPRVVSGFFTSEDLDNLLFIREEQTPLRDTAINNKIVERGYQQEAIRRVAEQFEAGKRKALLVMATGTGKTRVAMALIDLFLRTNQVRKVLFLADRDALVDQALTDGFKAHLPEEPRDRIFTASIDKTKRLYVATLPTILRCYQEFSPAFFDLIIFDEAHRSIFNRITEVIDYFDSRMIGLTATPAEFIDRDTFRVFDCQNKRPTFLYTYQQAIDEKILVDYRLYQAQTKFQRKGIKGAALSNEEKNSLIAQGKDPDEINYSGTEIEKKVSNKGTLRAQWQEIWDVCIKDESGQLPGKTIIFALTKKHAERLADIFDEIFPQFNGEMVQVITSDTERVRDGSYGDGLITKFKKEDLPRIAISVDMLDTGIDIPEITNLVFMKPVYSKIKLWQMIGRGTRSNEACHYFERLPNGRKTEFKIIDFWENEFNKGAEETAPQSLPVLITIFNTRLKMLSRYLDNQDSSDCQRVIADLRGQITQIPTDSFTIKKVFPQVEDAWKDSFWRRLTKDKIEFLKVKVGPLLRFASEIDVQAATFINKVERLKLDILMNRVQPASLQSIAEDVDRLPDFVHEDKARKELIELALSPSRLGKASHEELSRLITALSGQMKYRRERPNTLLEIDLDDSIEARGEVVRSAASVQAYEEEYREHVERRILELIEDHPTIAAIQQGRKVTDQQLLELEHILREDLTEAGAQSFEKIEKTFGVKAGGLLAVLRQLLNLNAAALPDYKTIVQRSFEQYINEHTYTADQLRFLRAVQSVFLQQRKLERADLYEGALISFGMNAVERLFTEKEITELLDFTEQLAA